MIYIYHYYDIAIWSQTHWKWLEIKLIELGILGHTRYQISFVLDKSSMFRYGVNNSYIKPLHIIWAKFPQWGKHNTLHIDDLEKNFQLNPSNGLLVTPYHHEGVQEEEKGERKRNETRDHRHHHRHSHNSQRDRRHNNNESGNESNRSQSELVSAAEDNELFLLTRCVIIHYYD